MRRGSVTRLSFIELHNAVTIDTYAQNARQVVHGTLPRFAVASRWVHMCTALLHGRQAEQWAFTKQQQQWHTRPFGTYQLQSSTMTSNVSLVQFVYIRMPFASQSRSPNIAESALGITSPLASQQQPSHHSHMNCPLGQRTPPAPGQRRRVLTCCLTCSPQRWVL